MKVRRGTTSGPGSNQPVESRQIGSRPTGPINRPLAANLFSSSPRLATASRINLIPWGRAQQTSDTSQRPQVLPNIIFSLAYFTQIPALAGVANRENRVPIWRRPATGRNHGADSKPAPNPVTVPGAAQIFDVTWIMLRHESWKKPVHFGTLTLFQREWPTVPTPPIWHCGCSNFDQQKLRRQATGRPSPSWRSGLARRTGPGYKPARANCSRRRRAKLSFFGTGERSCERRTGTAQC
jgi:hypothetical protein